MIQRSFRYKLAPTPEQAETLAQFAGVTRLIYNLALEQRRDFWRHYQTQTGKTLNFISQGRQVTELRAQVDWIGAVPSGILTQALRDLDRAFANFWAGRSRYPTPRRKGQHDSFRSKAVEVRWRSLNRRWGAVRIQNLGWVKYRVSRPLHGKVVNATVSHCAEGWFVSFTCEIEHEAAPLALPAVGIDRGITNTIALSTGELLSTPDTSALERRKAKAQRVLARRSRGSSRYQKQRRRLGRISAKIGRIRADWRHKATLDIAKRFGTVAIEDLNTKGMTRAGKGKAKRGLNRSILEQGWGAFERVLAYKLDERGGTLVKVNPAYSSQTCSACGVIDRASRESQASFACQSCGFASHADTNAAINILRRSTASMRVEDGELIPAVETRTANHALAA